MVLPVPPPVLQLPWGTTPDGRPVTLTPQALQFLQQLWTGIGSGAGAVTGPGTSVIGDFATWANTTGTQLQDGGDPGAVILGFNTAQLVPGSNITITPVGGTLVFASTASGSGDVHGPSSSGSGNLVLFNGTTGKIIQDAGLPPGNLAFLNTITTSLITNFTSSVETLINSYLLAGTNVTLTPIGSNLVISATSGIPVDYFAAYESNIRVANSAGTNTTNLNNLILAAAGSGGGTIYFNESGDIQINSTINLMPNVSIWMTTAAILKWTGSSVGTIVDSGIGQVLGNCCIRMNVNEGTSFSGVVYYIHSAIGCDLDLWADGTQTSSGVFVQFFADSTAGSTVYGPSRNSAFNRVRVTHLGTCGQGFIMTGINSGFGGQPQIPTDNTFYSFTFGTCLSRGIKINIWCDSNNFEGYTYIALGAANAIGIIANEGRTNNGTVYNTTFQHVAVDIFGALGGRIGVAFQESKGMIIDELLVGPTFEGGSFIGSNCTSYQVRELVNSGSTVSTSNGGPAANDSLFIHQKAVTTGL